MKKSNRPKKRSTEVESTELGRREPDRLDQRILSRLQEDGRISMAQLARELHLSVTPCVERVKRLEEQGYITAYRAELSPSHMGQHLLAYVQVALDRTTPEIFDRFRTAMEVLDFVQEAHMVAGGFDYLEDPRSRHEGVSERSQCPYHVHSRRAADAHLFRDGGSEEFQPGAGATLRSVPLTLKKRP